MAFLPNFENDIFISYARLNDETPPGGDKGWVTLFREKLEFELSQRFERRGDVKIWRDKEEIGGSTFFNDAIKQSIDKSGIFVALTSRGYLSKESYCHDELIWFYQKVKAEPCGLKVGTRSRLINVLLQNIPPKEWFPEMEGMGGVPFHDARQDTQFGRPLRPNDQAYEDQIVKLADELETTLRTFKTLTEVTTSVAQSARSKNLKVFLAYAEGPLRDTRDRVAEELRSKGVEVNQMIPPPEPSVLHENAVNAELGNAGLSVHLLDDQPGSSIVDAAGKRYSQEQVELGIKLGRRQLICVPKALDVETIDSRSHSDFIRQLESGQRDKANYRFLRETPPGLIAHEVLQEIEKVLKEKAPAAGKELAAVLDIHELDEDLAPELSRVFLKRRLKLLINPASDEPQENMTIFDDVRKGVSVLIIVLGHVTDLWASRRLNFGLQVAVSSLKFCGIYVPPIDGTATPRPIDINVFRIPPVNFPVRFVFSPQMLAGFLDEFV